MGINLPSTRPPIISSGSLSATGFPTVYNWNRPPWMFQYPVVGNPWQPSAALGAHNQAPPGTTGTGPKSRLCKECPAPAAEASGRMLDKLEVIKGTNHWVCDRTILKSVSFCYWKVRTTGICRKFYLDKKVKCNKFSSGSLSATGFPTAYNWNRPPWMFQYPVVGNPWQPSAALGAHNQAVSVGLCPTSQEWSGTGKIDAHRLTRYRIQAA
jgi:hypothetical protein